ncbi:hypothetical protein GUITHDRAFT_143068 [Guillardia theta CCMP2712]|uniref:Uncharacterized protein n=1 Tax=Guillardia theta (strain CCMP2712) TaxID=905079 RepID=L1IWB1_GUITC|nr:hypothetical protein GUITHDRAFT_143068 [Guillardia theta CCMP2712]EKX40130.1 hypothetical protein GUITHDRAFT_143068 [Guillardia theta CCMP2712]|eukprot:XP_005827110.1 hypothetical protein GUITHDRAFT_143068 [Guillardia theta CCMP2712]
MLRVWALLGCLLGSLASSPVGLPSLRLERDEDDEDDDDDDNVDGVGKDRYRDMPPPDEIRYTHGMRTGKSAREGAIIQNMTGGKKIKYYYGRTNYWRDVLNQTDPWEQFEPDLHKGQTYADFMFAKERFDNVDVMEQHGPLKDRMRDLIAEGRTTPAGYGLTIVHNDDLSVSLSNKSRLLEPDEVFARFVPYQNASYPEPTKSRDRYIKAFEDQLRSLMQCGGNVSWHMPPDMLAPLHYAALNGHLEIVKILIEKGVNVSARDDWDRTPLHWAGEDRAYNGHVEVAKELIANGANVMAKVGRRRWEEEAFDAVAQTKGDCTPYSFASMFMHTHNDVIRYFRDQESKLNPSILNKDTSTTNFLDDEMFKQRNAKASQEQEDVKKKSSSDTSRSNSSSSKTKKSKSSKDKSKSSRDKPSRKTPAETRKDEDADELLRGMGAALSQAVPKPKLFDPLAGLSFGLPSSGADRGESKRKEEASRTPAADARDFGMEDAANLIKSSGVRTFAEHHAPSHPSRSTFASSNLSILSEESLGDSQTKVYALPSREEEEEEEEEETEEQRFSKFGNIRMAGDLLPDEQAPSVQREKTKKTVGAETSDSSFDLSDLSISDSELMVDTTRSAGRKGILKKKSSSSSPSSRPSRPKKIRFGQVSYRDDDPFSRSLSSKPQTFQTVNNLDGKEKDEKEKGGLFASKFGNIQFADDLGGKQEEQEEQEEEEEEEKGGLFASKFGNIQFADDLGGKQEEDGWMEEEEEEEEKGGLFASKFGNIQFADDLGGKQDGEEIPAEVELDEEVVDDFDSHGYDEDFHEDVSACEEESRPSSQGPAASREAASREQERSAQIQRMEEELSFWKVEAMRLAAEKDETHRTLKGLMKLRTTEQAGERRVDTDRVRSQATGSDSGTSRPQVFPIASSLMDESQRISMSLRKPLLDASEQLLAANLHLIRAAMNRSQARAAFQQRRNDFSYTTLEDTLAYMRSCPLRPQVRTFREALEDIRTKV